MKPERILIVIAVLVAVVLAFGLGWKPATNTSQPGVTGLVKKP